MADKIDTVAARKALPPRPAPYFQRLEAGAYIGYRKPITGDGSWVVRWRDESGKQTNHTLGTFDSFDAACKSAREWLERAKGGITDVVTVAEACRRYVTDRRSEKGENTAKDAESRFKQLIYGHKIGRISLSDLKTAHITDWRNEMIELDDDSEEDPDSIRRAKDTANRNLSSFKAALNLSYRMGLVAITSPWDRVESFKGVGKRRERFLTITERKSFYTAATPQLKRLILALLLTGARPGEIASANVGDLAPSGLLKLEGKTGRRIVPISPEAFEHLTKCAGNRPDDSPLVLRDDEERWNRFYWRDQVQDAREAAGLPDDVVLYSLRHCAISEMLVGGLDPMTVARITGTSVIMIQRHYGHLMKDAAAAKLAKVKMM